MKVRTVLKINNEKQWIAVQKKAFDKGYKWSNFGKKLIAYKKHYNYMLFDDEHMVITKRTNYPLSNNWVRFKMNPSIFNFNYKIYV